MFFEQMHKSWQQALAAERECLDSLESQCSVVGNQLAPTIDNVMRAFQTPLSQVRVLIIGQDPYPTIGHAIGLAFAVKAGLALPRSLANIVTELGSDLPAVAATGEIWRWQNRGVLLLNRHLTTLVGATGSHVNLGWSKFTDAAIRALAESQGKNLVAMLWGKHAQSARGLLSGCNLIESAHPSPLSAHRGFFGSRPFSRCNEMLMNAGLEPIDWSC
jgi:uracil-DNA glycosylase